MTVFQARRSPEEILSRLSHRPGERRSQEMGGGQRGGGVRGRVFRLGHRYREQHQSGDSNNINITRDPGQVVQPGGAQGGLLKYPRSDLQKISAERWDYCPDIPPYLKLSCFLRIPVCDPGVGGVRPGQVHSDQLPVPD